MIRTFLALMISTAAVSSALAALPFTCKADGDTWTVLASPNHKMACSLRCILHGDAGQQDTVSCSPTVSPGPHPDPVCEGFLLGRKWKTAMLVAGECSSVEP